MATQRLRQLLLSHRYLPGQRSPDHACGAYLAQPFGGREFASDLDPLLVPRWDDVTQQREVSAGSWNGQ